jgi:hypothetical protein
LLAYQTTVTGPLQFPTEGKILAGNSRGTTELTARPQVVLMKKALIEIFA